MKDIEWSWRNPYQDIYHGDYSQINLYEYMEDQFKDIYSKIIRSYLHKAIAHPIVLPCVEVIEILATNTCIKHMAHGFLKLASYKLPAIRDS